ncbi:hypothetical protein A6X21_00150 [Planctopirus hydrillae]|uniref:Uncharacterized protein n=2 Tax=Planctopirus hydrillae TaxID=1841610 RepID=A0A1C3EAR3_9PLAN|nr:hypothetical protein A6X21_00150 [Planctopirus hydrillae]
MQERLSGEKASELSFFHDSQPLSIACKGGPANSWPGRRTPYDDKKPRYACVSGTLARVFVGEGGTKCRVRVLPLGM